MRNELFPAAVYFFSRRRFQFLAALFFVCAFSSVFLYGASTEDSSKSAAEETQPAVTEEVKPVVTSDTHLKDEPSPKFPTLADVTVISSRLPSFKTRLSDIPANISYIPANVSYKSKGELDSSRDKSLPDAVRDVEGGIFYDQVGNGVDTVFSLRGFAEGSTVIVLVDGVRVNEVDGNAVNYPLIPMNDIESIQIDRGSASPIYGSGAFAGVVNIITRRPSKKLVSAFGGMELSSFKGIKFNEGVSGSVPDKLTPLDGKFTYYFNGGRDLNDGFRSNGKWRITNFDIKTGYELPNEEGGLRIGVKHIRDAISNPGALTLDEYSKDPGQSKQSLDGRQMKSTIVRASADKKFWDDRVSASILPAIVGSDHCPVGLRLKF